MDPTTLPDGASSPVEEFDEGDLVWFDPGVGYVIPGEVMAFHKQPGQQSVTVQAIISGKPQLFTVNDLSHVKKRQDLGQFGFDDMTKLTDLNEASLLWNLKIRYEKELIYTYIGSILVAVNPYRMFDIYGLDMVKKYAGKILGMQPPHLFAIGSAAYSNMIKERESHVILVSGESGAGKTESSKLLMQYLAAVNKSSSNLTTEQILEAIPLLESFGNAKTLRNDNASRFGKYIQLFFKEGAISGAKTSEYLLEKYRVVTHLPEERNFHVFYELLEGLRDEEKEKYGLQTSEKYFYLNQGGNVAIEGKNDADDFQSLLAAMQVLGFSMGEQDNIFRILAAILHLGNVYFHRRQLRHGQEGVELGSDAQIKWAAHLLQISLDGILQSLTFKTTILEARQERVYTPLNIDQALDARDALAKALYQALFSWLVHRINQITSAKNQKHATVIAILDIFGFEDSRENTFEQLCINHANEVLQNHFYKHVFKLDQQEYGRERLEWVHISYPDNHSVIHLLARKPIGIFHLLDEESNFPKATDVSFLEKCHYNHALNELYSRPRMSSLEFGIRHYAGQVWYSVDGFLEKNRDPLRSDILELLCSSKIQMVSKMFRDLRNSQDAWRHANRSSSVMPGGQAHSPGAGGRFASIKPRAPTVALRFQDSLSTLMESIQRYQPWFIRCIKPNSEKIPKKFDMPLVLDQLRYSAMLETVQIRKLGYPVRYKYASFVSKYRCLLPAPLPRGTPLKDVTKIILETVPHSKDQRQFGTTKVFLREDLERSLERDRLEVQSAAAVQIQKRVKGYLRRKKFQQQKEAAVVIQKNFRMYRQRQRFTRLRKGVVRAQANYRMIRQRRFFNANKLEMKRKVEQLRAARQQRALKAQREDTKQQRTSQIIRAETGPGFVNQLDIPAELAFIISKLDDWTPPHVEKNIVKVIGRIPSTDILYKLPFDIDYYVFTKFTNVFFKSHLWGVKKEPIKTPFLAKSKDSDFNESLAIFKLIMRFTNDGKLSGKREKVLADYIVNKGLQNEKLRDEILCQICNQTWQNENPISNERCWQLMAHCLSAFAPSPALYKYLLKYVSDHAFNGYKGVCQRKLLQSALEEGKPHRANPPCLLEWRANRKKSNMALEASFADGETWYGPVESWTTGEEFARVLARERGIKDPFGWSIAIADEREQYELNGCDYILDVISEIELPPAFPLGKGARKARRKAEQVSPSTAPSSSTRPHSPSADSSPSEVPAPSDALSRTSALNDRYFAVDEGHRNRSRSLDNLEQVAEQSPLEKMGLAKSRLNERYHSVDHLGYPSAGEWDGMPLAKSVMNQRYFPGEELRAREDGGGESEAAESERRRKMSEPQGRLNMTGQNNREGEGSPRRRISTSEFSATDFVSMHGPPPEETKLGPGGRVRGQRRYPPPAGGRMYLDREGGGFAGPPAGGYLRSSAMSDTSEAPSLASHVRRVRVPSQASDVDQFLDDLFMPVLDDNLDELSDAKSLAASIKGGRGTAPSSGGWGTAPSSDDVDEEVERLTSHRSLHRRRSILTQVEDYSFTGLRAGSSLEELHQVEALTRSLKGHGQDPSGASTSLHGPFAGRSTPSGPPGPMGQGMPGAGAGFFAGTPGGAGMMPPFGMMPMFNQQGDPLTSTPQHPQAQLTAHPASAFNPLMMYLPLYNAQQQAALSMSQQSVTSLLQPTPMNTSMEQPANKSSLNQQRAFLQSALAQNLQIQQQLVVQNQALAQLLSQSVSFEDILTSSFNDSSDDLGATRGHTHQDIPPQQTRRPSKISNVFQDTSPKTEPVATSSPTKTSPGNRTSFVPPPPPPRPPTPPSEPPPPLLDAMGRAKTVRIGKWRWPPPRTESDDQTDSFMDFKMRQQHKRGSVGGSSSGKDSGGKRDSIGGEGVEWAEFEIGNNGLVADPRTGAPLTSTPQRRGSSEEIVERRVFEMSSAHKTGSVGKLQISSEMKMKLERIHASTPDVNSPAGTTRPRSPSREESSTTPSGDGGQRVVKRLDDSRKALLQAQLSGSLAQRTQAQTKETQRPSLPPSTPLHVDTALPPPQRNAGNATRPNRSSKEETTRVGTSADERGFPMSESTASYLDDEFATRSLESVKTKLHLSQAAPFSTYARVPWTMHIRKEVFSPRESLSNQLALHLIFTQIVQDVLTPIPSTGAAGGRITRSEQERMSHLLDSYGITVDNVASAAHKASIKRHVVEVAREWPFYFARLFPVTGGREHGDINLLGVSHAGVRLIRRGGGQDADGDGLRTVQSFRWEEIQGAIAPRSSLVTLTLRGGNRLSFYSFRANQIARMVQAFSKEAEKGSQDYARAVADYVTQEPTLLSFRKGDIIKVTSSKNNEPGWLSGVVNGRGGVFPAEYVEPVSRSEAIRLSTMDFASGGDAPAAPDDAPEKDPGPWTDPNSLHRKDGQRDSEQGTPKGEQDGRNSFLQYAIIHFRDGEKLEILHSPDEGSLSKGGTGTGTKTKKGKGKAKNKEEWTWKEATDMVKFTRSPIHNSLLKLETPEMNKLSLDCFLCVMRYMGDYPMGKGQSEVDCVYTLLMNCHKWAALRDEVYCQIMKQTTNNKSAVPESCQRGWRLFSILAAYFSCSETLKPTLFKHLESAAFDKRRAYHGTALVCLQNLRKTFKYGGRKNVPSIEEITAITAGRNSKRQIYRLPGGTERVINTKSTTVVQDIIEEICGILNIHSPEEMEEFSLYCIVEGDTFTMPLAKEEYILDVTTELHKNQQIFYLIFCRSVWHYPLRLDNQLYIELVFNQIAPDYLEGLLLVMPGETLEQDYVYDIAKVASLLHRAADMDHLPTMKETKFLLPKPALTIRDIKPPQWVNMVQGAWQEIESLTPTNAKAQVLEILQKWPLFGSSFFAIKRVADPREKNEYILALNKHGVHFLDLVTHETLIHYPYSEVISTRKVKAEDNTLYLDMKCGNLMQPKFTRIQTDQAHEISRLIRQYITIEQRTSGTLRRGNEQHPGR